MKLLNSLIPKLIEFAGIPSDSGNLWFAEFGKDLPFLVKRVYYIVDVPMGAERGAHAHKTLDQVMIAIKGSFVVDIADGVDNWAFTMQNPGKGLFLPSGVWRTLRAFSEGSVCLVLASERYEADDYIRDYDEFLKWKQSQTDC